jgi:hypothetical protein
MLDGLCLSWGGPISAAVYQVRVRSGGSERRQQLIVEQHCERVCSITLPTVAAVLRRLKSIDGWRARRAADLFSGEVQAAARHSRRNYSHTAPAEVQTGSRAPAHYDLRHWLCGRSATAL